MITDSFDLNSPAIINPKSFDKLHNVDACLVTFSNQIEETLSHSRDFSHELESV